MFQTKETPYRRRHSQNGSTNILSRWYLIINFILIHFIRHAWICRVLVGYIFLFLLHRKSYVILATFCGFSWCFSRSPWSQCFTRFSTPVTWLSWSDKVWHCSFYFLMWLIPGTRDINKKRNPGLHM